MAVPVFFLVFFFLLSCNVRPRAGFQQEVASRPLSNDSLLRTCAFDPGYQIVHFPMWHRPPENSENTPIESFERVVRSQFQLLHTLLDYNRSYTPLAVFEESITQDSYNENYITRLKQGAGDGDFFTALDGTIYYFAQERRRAITLFQGGFPAFYEQMNTQQKQLLFDLGASKVLYFLEEIPRLYSVISPNDFDLLKAQMGGNLSVANIESNRYWIYTFREQRLRDKILSFRQLNPDWNGLIFITYGANHDFADDFLGLPFQSGHAFCLNWIDRT